MAKPKTYWATTTIELPYGGRTLRAGDDVDTDELAAHGQAEEQIGELLEQGALTATEPQES